MSKKQRHIRITGARANNLKNVGCDIPHGQITVITGPSGSGKSSLAFDTLYAEGQRRYLESMSSYARQFLQRIEKPDVENIQGIQPAIALEQKNHVRNARSTVGTATEIYDYLRVLYAHIGRTVCDVCDGEVTKADPLQICAYLEQTFEDGQKLLLLSPVMIRDRSVESLLSDGFFRIFRNGEIIEVQPLQDSLNPHDIVRVVVDRLIFKKGKIGARVLESIKAALALGDGKIEIYDPAAEKTHPFKTEYACLDCHKVFTEPFPNLFSFNSPLGACRTCEGYGRIIGLDLDKVIPNKNLSLREGAIHPFTTPSNRDVYDDLIREGTKRRLQMDAPYKDLTDAEKTFVIEGGGRYEGIRPFFDIMETKKYKVHVRVMLAKYRGYYLCPSCMGSRIRPEALNILVGGKNILDIGNLPADQLLAFFSNIELTEHEAKIAERLLREIQSRLEYLNRVGLSYLTLNRQARTLSGGEAQRINLSAALGGRLTDTLYILDEPTVGLHARDTHRLIDILKNLRDHGNTIILVEHDPEVMLEADHLIDMGPTGGEDGGRILFEGTPAELRDSPFSLTGRYLGEPQGALDKSVSGNGKKTKAKKKTSQKPADGETVMIRDAWGNNLKHINVVFPTHQLVCVTGVSGSGKSTLMKQTLFAAYEHSQGRSLNLDIAPHGDIEGLDRFKDVILVDQTPPGRSARSNPATYVKAWDDIRTLFAASRKSMVLGIRPGDFSFNSPGGRCETCEGLGTLTIDMQFMADVTVTCHECQGRRFKEHILNIELDGKNINDILNLTLDEAMDFFRGSPRLLRKLAPLHEIGLGYLKLGQSTSTLSGGEAQRLKLASYLKSSNTASDKYLFLFDEPTTGLHMADIDRLVQAFRRLMDAGHSVIVIEHNIDFIAQCDWLIDLGPEGGEGGGYIVAEGSVADVMSEPKSYTGQFLKKRFIATVCANER